MKNQNQTKDNVASVIILHITTKEKAGLLAISFF